MYCLPCRAGASVSRGLRVGRAPTSSGRREAVAIRDDEPVLACCGWDAWQTIGVRNGFRCDVSGPVVSVADARPEKW